MIPGLSAAKIQIKLKVGKGNVPSPTSPYQMINYNLNSGISIWGLITEMLSGCSDD